MSKPWLSVIVCANGDNRFFADALLSLKCAKNDDQGIELILVANGGWQPPQAICGYFDRIELIAEGGLGNARNEGVAVATGTWVTFFDSDDLLRVDYFDKIKDVVRSASRGDIFFNGVVSIDENSSQLRTGGLLERFPPVLSLIIAHPFTGATMVIRKHDFVSAAGYDWSSYAEDYHLTLKLFFCDRFKFRRNFASEYLYRKHVDTMSGARDKKILGVRAVQLDFARRGWTRMYFGVLVSTFRLFLTKVV